MRQYLRHILTSFATFALLSLAIASHSFAQDGALSGDVVIDGLFASLQESHDAGDIQRLTAEIWTRWSIHPTHEHITRRLARGITMMNQGDYVHAEGIFTDIIEQDPTFAEAWNRRATIYYITGQLAKSQADIARTLELEPRHFGALSGLAMIELGRENFALALRAYEAAAAVNPHMPQVNAMIESLTEKLRGIPL